MYKTENIFIYTILNGGFLLSIQETFVRILIGREKANNIQ